MAVLETRPLHTFCMPMGSAITTGGLFDRTFLDLGSDRNVTRLITLHSWIFILCVLVEGFVKCSNARLCSLITSAANGFGTSMMNGLQSLPQWMSAFDNPSNKTLGVLNAIQVGG